MYRPTSRNWIQKINVENGNEFTCMYMYKMEGIAVYTTANKPRAKK